MILKEYLKDCVVDGPNKQLVIMITHNKSMFLANDGYKKVWTLDGYDILRPKGRRKDIIVSGFLLLWSRLNLFSLLSKKQ